MSRPIIAFLTDFGTCDHYAGTMKGVVLGICPDATLVDITHEIPPHDVLGGALELAAAFRYFPPGTVFVAVVDPGVGSARRGIAAEAGEYRFVAPDNGVLSLALRELPTNRVVDLTSRRYARPTVSRTFEGRDRFAPAAAWLARGTELGALGPPIRDYQQLDVPVAGVAGSELKGEVLRVDRFGNLVTNIDRHLFETFADAAPIHITAGGHPIDRIVGTYADAADDAVCALFGSTDRLEIAVNSGSAVERLGLKRGAPVVITRVP